MIKILTPTQVKELDQFTIAQEQIPSIDLMERACRAFTVWFTEKFNALNKIGIICGTGNNGGDGLGIAYHLKDWGYPVKVWIVKGSTAPSPDFEINYKRLLDAHVPLFEISEASDQFLVDDRDVLIDAIFGSGLSRPVEGIYASTIQHINNSKSIRVAVDIPSGLMAAQHSTGAIVRADFTVSFQLPKLSFLLPQYQTYVGDWRIVDIGLNKKFIKEADTTHFYTSAKAIKKLLTRRSKFDHKGTYGHALLIAGSKGKAGAAVLSGRAVLRSGVGLLTIHTPDCNYNVVQTSVPEAMLSSDTGDDYISHLPNLEPYNTIGIGPGIGQSSQTCKMVGSLLENFRKPLVIDADALNILGSHRELLHLVPEGSILTPHPKEFERLAGEWKDDYERLGKQKSMAAQLKSIVVVKGAYTTIASPDGELFFNATGNPGMATGGSGDVLTGILTGLLAQQYSALYAALLGVYLHGLSGDLANLEKGEESLIASDIIEFLPLAFRQLKR